MSICRVSEAVAMEPAWRQQGRGRGRSQEAQGERSRPPQQKEKERPGGAAAGPWGAGRGGRTKTAAAPEPQRGEDGRVLTCSWASGDQTGWRLFVSVTDRCVGPVQVRGDQEVQPGCCSAIGGEPDQLLLWRRRQWWRWSCWPRGWKEREDPGVHLHHLHQPDRWAWCSKWLAVPSVPSLYAKLG